MALPPTLTLGGIDRTAYLRAVESIQVSYRLGTKGTLSCELRDLSSDTASAYRASTDLSVGLTAGDGTVLFSGISTEVGDEAIVEPDIAVLTPLQAIDHSRVAGQRHMANATFAAGQTLKQIATTVVANYLAVFGITLDPAMATGPTLATESVVENESVENFLNHLSEMTGWIWRITPTKVLEFFAAGTKTASFTLSTANANIRGGPRWSKTRDEYINRVYVKFGTATQVEKTKQITGDGVRTAWLLDYKIVTALGFAATRGYVTEGAANLPLSLYTLGGSGWMIDPATNTLHKSTPPALGTAISFIYTAQFPDTVSAEDAAEIALNGPSEDLVLAPDIFDKDVAQAYANALIRKYKGLPRTLTIRTRAGFVLPGTSIPVTVPERTLSGSWLVTGVTARDEADHGFLYEYECIEGTEAQSVWVDFWKAAIGKSVTSTVGGGSVSGTLIPSLSGTFLTDVIANASQNHVTSGAQVALRGNRLNAAFSGPAIELGSETNTFTWWIVADMLTAGTPSRGLYFVSQSGTALRLGQDPLATAGAYYVTPVALAAVRLGARTSSAFGPNHQITDVATIDLDVSNGLTERGRTTKAGEWQTFSPAWTAVSVNPAIGNGELRGRYTQVGMTVTAEIYIGAGSTTTFGTGDWRVSLPHAAHTDSLRVATGYARDDSTATRYFLHAGIVTSTTIAPFADVTTVNFSPTVPFTWAVNDSMRLTIVYERT